MIEDNSLTPEQILALIAQAQAGDAAAFERLYEHYYQPILRYILLRVGDMDDAEDLAQKTFLKLAHKLVIGSHGFPFPMKEDLPISRGLYLLHCFP